MPCCSETISHPINSTTQLLPSYFPAPFSPTRSTPSEEMRKLCLDASGGGLVWSVVLCETTNDRLARPQSAGRLESLATGSRDKPLPSTQDATSTGDPSI